jgi:hypothetical protein
LVLILLQVVGDPRLSMAGHLLVAVWDRIPGHEIVSAPVTAFSAVVGGLLEAVGLGRVAEVLASLGPVLLGLAVTVGLFYALAKVGLGRWHDWDRRERRAMLPEIPILRDRSIAGAQAMLLVGGLLSLVFAAFGWAPAAALVMVLGAAAGLIIWARRPFGSAERPTRSAG